MLPQETIAAFGASYYVHRELIKTAGNATRALSYLVRKGVFGPSCDGKHSVKKKKRSGKRGN